MNFILCDEIDSGKSSLVLRLAHELIADGKSASGFVTTAHMEDGKKLGHDFVLIRNNSLDEPIPFTRPHPFENSFRWRRYFFNKYAFEAADALELSSDIIVMDEIGPLELEDKLGFFTFFQRALAIDRPKLVVVRKSLEGAIASVTGGKCRIYGLSEAVALRDALRQQNPLIFR
jgi:nucleoside-triphosphatase THEP1